MCIDISNCIVPMCGFLSFSLSLSVCLSHSQSLCSHIHQKKCVYVRIRVGLKPWLMYLLPLKFCFSLVRSLLCTLHTQPKPSKQKLKIHAENVFARCGTLNKTNGQQRTSKRERHNEHQHEYENKQHSE